MLFNAFSPSMVLLSPSTVNTLFQSHGSDGKSMYGDTAGWLDIIKLDFPMHAFLK